MRRLLLLTLLLPAVAAMAHGQEIATTDRLPGDMPPPSLAVMLRPPSNRPTGHDGPPPDTTLSPPLELGVEAARAAIAACAKDGLRIGVAITDAAGQLRIGLTADGAAPGLIYAAVRKDLAAIAYGAPTSAVQALLQQDRGAAARLSPAMAVKPGALPLVISGKIIGAIGASGATAQQDEACAAVGAKIIQDRL